MKKLFRNKYFLSLLVFSVWMIFFDQNSFISQRKFNRELNQLEAQKLYYTNQNELLMTQKNELLGNIQNLERLAREKYLMKRDDEDVYIVKVKE